MEDKLHIFEHPVALFDNGDLHLGIDPNAAEKSKIGEAHHTEKQAHKHPKAKRHFFKALSDHFRLHYQVSKAYF